MKGLPHNAVNVRATMAHHPVLARSFGAFAATVLTELSVPRRQRELVILRMGWNCQSRYEFGQHTLYGKAHGVTDEEVAAVTRPLALYPWTEDDRIILQMTDDLYTDDCVSEETWTELAARWTHPEIMEFMMSALCYRVVSGFLNSFGVELDDGVPGWPE